MPGPRIPRRLIALVAAALFPIASTALAQTGGAFDLGWGTFGGGGAASSTGGGYALGGTIGQADAGAQAAGRFALVGGFWSAAGPAQAVGSATPTATSSAGSATSTPSPTATSPGAAQGITWHTMDSGGGTSTGGGFALGGSVGQPDAGAMAGGSYSLAGGFWAGAGAAGPAATSTPTSVATGTQTGTPGASSTSTATPLATTTPTATPAAGSTATATPLATGTPTPAPGALALEIEPGWNLLALPTGESWSHTAASLLAALAADGIDATHIARWRQGSWESHLRGFPVNDFTIEPGRGYFVRTANSGVWHPRPRTTP